MNLLFKLKRKIYKLTHPALGEVLMLHRVTNERSILLDNRMLEITPDFLEQTILKYKSRGYRFVSLDDIYTQMTTKQLFKQKFVCFTLDDGYRDNYEIAYPVFKKYNVPFTIYLTTDFADGKALLWWYILEDILMANDELKLSDGSEYQCATLEEKNRVFCDIREKVFSLPAVDMQKTLNDLFASNAFLYDEENRLALTWEQIHTLSKDALCTIASHTQSHPVLTNSSTTDILNELQLSKKEIEDKIGKMVEHFAYPYGKWDENTVEVVKQAEYKTAVLANGGLTRKDDSVFRMKRNVLIEK